MPSVVRTGPAYQFAWDVQLVELALCKHCNLQKQTLYLSEATVIFYQAPLQMVVIQTQETDYSYQDTN